jgi:hypothetical protein
VTGTQAAHLFLSTTTSTPAGAAGPFDFQPIDSGTIQILLDTPVNGKNNLLTVNFTAGGILAFDGSSTPAFSATDSLSPGETVTYSSDFLNISGSSAGNAFQFITSNANPPISIDADGFLAAFASEDLSSYTFDNANQQVSAPEPASLGFVGLSAMALLRRRK